jgi:hypothetical protein
VAFNCQGTSLMQYRTHVLRNRGASQYLCTILLLPGTFSLDTIPLNSQSKHNHELPFMNSYIPDLRGRTSPEAINGSAAGFYQ